MTNDRIRRPELERNEPVRDWSTMFQATGTNGHSGPNAAREQQEPERDVAMGYRVIEEYMRRGAAAARQMSQGGGDALGSGAANQLFERLLQSATDLGGVWIEMLQTLWSTQASATPSGADPGAFELREPPSAPATAPATQGSDAADGPPQSHPPKPRTSVAFRVQGGRDVEVSATLSAEPTGETWLVHDLRALDAAVPRIERVQIAVQPELARCVIALEIQNEQPAGVYSGLIVDAQTNLPRGTVSVRLY